MFISSLEVETNFLAWIAAEKDTTKGAGWERFDFDKDAPLDDEEVEGQFSCEFLFLLLDSLYK